MIQFDDIGNLLESFLELLDFLEVVTQLDDWGRLKHPLLVDNKLTMLERVYIALDEEKVGARFDRQETRTRDVDTMATLEMLNGCTGSSFELKMYNVSTKDIRT
jgi:hypothetical protein